LLQIKVMPFLSYDYIFIKDTSVYDMTRLKTEVW
jgi:hypothetical protein